MSLTQFTLTSIHKILSRNREYYYKLADQADRIIVWLVGFSITSIALSISNKQLLHEISSNISTIIVTFSSFTIITGILYRTFMYIAQNLEHQMLINFEGYIEGYNNQEDFLMSREIKDNESISDLLSFLKVDFDKELKEFENIDESKLSIEQKNKLQKNLTTYYNNLADIYNKDIERQIKEIKVVLKSNLGYSEKKIDKAFNPVKPKINWHKFYWFSIYLSSFLFIATTLIFTSGFVIFIIKYLNNIISS